MILIKKMLPTDSNCTESESHDNNYNSNRNGDKVGSEEQDFDNLEGLG